MTSETIPLHLAIWTYAIAILALLLLGDIASFARLFAVAGCFGIEAMARMPEPAL